MKKQTFPECSYNNQIDTLPGSGKPTSCSYRNARYRAVPWALMLHKGTIQALSHAVSERLERAAQNTPAAARPLHAPERL